GATITFRGGLSLTTTTNAAFTATGGGTINVCSTTDCAPLSVAMPPTNAAVVNTISTTTGTALNVANTTIGSNNLEFKSITVGTAASGPANGIILNTTGSSGRLRVKGDGAAARNGSGGTIQHPTGDGVARTTTQG